MNKAYLHKKVFIRSTSTIVCIYSLAGEFICEWSRQHSKTSGWLIRSICQIITKFFHSGTQTISSKSRSYRDKYRNGYSVDSQSGKHEVQTYRMCLGILNFTKKYKDAALEECYRQEFPLDKQKYTFIKNTISVIAENIGQAGYNHTSKDNASKRGGFVMRPEQTDINSLLPRSKKLVEEQRKEIHDDVDR